MATLDGEYYLEKQLESIQNQEKCDVTVHVIDNGSTDRTLEILNQYFKNNLISKVRSSDSRGATKVFFELLNEVNAESYVAFSDQDDIWDVDKLRNLVENCVSDKPAMSFSNRRYINMNEDIIGHDSRLKKRPTWKNALIQNVAPGNTVVLNSKAVTLLKLFGSVDVDYYDSWIYLVLSMFGDVKYLDRETISYRIHPKNAVGLRRFIKLRKITTIFDSYMSQAHTLSKVLSDIPQLKPPKEFSNFIRTMSSKYYLRRFYAVIRCPMYRQSNLETFIFKMGIGMCLLFRYERQ